MLNNSCNQPLELMNQSKVVFPNRYERNPIQSAGECDFYDTETCEKYEAKLPFDKKEGELICRKDSELKDWLKFMMDEEAEFGEKIIVNRGKYQVADLRLYKTLEKRLHSVQEDENAIILFPYPIALDLEPVDGCLNIIGMTGDILSSIFSQLVRNNICYLLPVIFPENIALGLAPILFGCVFQVMLHLVVFLVKFHHFYNSGLVAVLCIHVPCGILYISHAASQGLLTSRTWTYALIYLFVMIVFTILFGQKLLSKKDSQYPFDEKEVEAGERFARKMGISR